MGKKRFFCCKCKGNHYYDSERGKKCLSRTRDFKVKIKAKDKEILFEGKNCRVVDKSLKTRLGFGDVKETIVCEKANFTSK